MTTWFRDFSEYTSGTDLSTRTPDEWTEIEPDGRWTQTTNGSAGLVIANNSAGGNEHLFFDVGYTTGDCEVVAKFKGADWSNVDFGITALGLSGSDKRTYGLYRNSAGNLRLIRCSDTYSYAEHVDQTDVAFTITTDTYYWIRIGRASGVIRAKIWADSGAEPGTWAWSASNSTLTSITGAILHNYPPCPSTYLAFGYSNEAGVSAPTSDSASSIAPLAMLMGIGR